MITSLNRRRILIYLLLAFGLTWGLDFIVYRNGGLENSPPLVDGVPISQALALITLSMWGPALANLITRAVTKEGRRDLWLRPHFRQGWPYWLLMWFLPAALSVLGAALYFGLFPANFDPTMRGFQAQMAEATGQAVDLPGSAMIALGFTQAVLLAPLLNALAVFGEEFGWRAYLQPKLMPLGARKTMLIMGVIWGVWHWPVIAMGYNYGVDYPGYPWLGPLAMVWFTMMVGTVLGWSVLRGKSVWPAVIGHGALNGIAGGAALFTTGTPNTLLGPLPVGLIGGIGWTVMALILWWRMGSDAPVSAGHELAETASADSLFGPG